MTAIVWTYADLDPRDDDRHATDPSVVCADADWGDCDGDLIERHTASGETLFLCESHDRSLRLFAAAIVSCLRAMPDVPVERAG